MRTEISESEYKFLYDLSIVRVETNRKNNIENKKQTNHEDDFEITFRGAIGEYGFAKIYNLKYDDTIYSRSGSPDFIYKGYRIDVKSPKHLNKYVYVRYKNYDYIDLFCFVYVEDRNIELIGFQRKDFICNERNLYNGQNGLCYKVKINDLIKFKEQLKTSETI